MGFRCKLICNSDAYTERPKDYSSKTEDIGSEISSCVLQRLLRVDIESSMGAQSPEEEHNDRDYDPCISLVYMD